MNQPPKFITIITIAILATTLKKKMLKKVRVAIGNARNVIV